MQSNDIPPPSQPEKLPSEVLGLSLEAAPSDEPEKRRIVDQLLDLAASCEFWHDPSGNPVATVNRSDHTEHYPIDSRAFDLWLRHQFYQQSGSGVPHESMKQAISTLNAKALFSGEEQPAHLRTARDREGNVWLNLCNDRWEAVKISPEGWKVVSNPTVRFLRQSGMRSLPTPVAGTIDPLWSLIHCAVEDRPLIAGFLLNALHPEGPYFGLNLYGSKGSAKSTATRFVRSLIDPNEAFSQSMPRSAEDLALAAQSQQIPAFENLSKMSDVESDWLCRLSTGDAIRRRTLYANSDETIFRAKRPWIINGIPDLVSRGDLIDRTLSVELLAIHRSERREEGAIIDQFNAAAPGILGALLNAVSLALRSVECTRNEFQGRLPRMADVALWITAGEAALGFNRGTFLRRHEEMTIESSADSVESNSVAITITELAETGWEGPMKDLLEEIESSHPTDRFLPKSPRGLGNVIRRLQSDLRDAKGVHCEVLPRTATGYPVRIWKEVHNLHDLHETPGGAGPDDV